MIPGLALIGGGMDSCVIDTRNFLFTSGFATVEMADSCYLSGFNIKTYDPTHGFGIKIREESGSKIYSVIKFNNIQQAVRGISLTSYSFTNSHSIINQNWISSVSYGINCELTSPIISENYINVVPHGQGITPSLYAEPLVINNIVSGINVTIGYYDFGANPRYYNNLLFGSGAYGFNDYGDTIVNNIVYGYNGGWGHGITGAGSYLRNNHIQDALVGLYYDIIGGPPPNVRYNNFWNNETNFEYFTGDSTNISADPMFADPDSMDFHLQEYSPLIDRGDPEILDKDGTRSDIGLYGGPYGERYEYMDLPPKAPVNLSATVDTDLILIKWNSNTEADFNHYNLYRDTTENFTADSSTFVASVEDTSYLHIRPEGINNLYFKLTASDNQGNISEPSEELHLVLTGTTDNEEFIINNYRLFQNYPNPFNPSTRIGYRLKERGYVKLYVYDIKGELVQTLVNQYQEGGYHEVNFVGGNELSSGIYIYQIMVRSEQNIPVFTDMKKMIYIK